MSHYCHSSSSSSIITLILLLSIHHPWLLHTQALRIHRKQSQSHHAIQGPIKTIVVLVMENRSFDHMLGWMKKLIPDLDGVNGTETNPISLSDPSSRLVHFSDRAEFVDPDPGHSYQDIGLQIFGASWPRVSSAGGKPLSSGPLPEEATMDGFAAQAESMATSFSATVMSGFRPENVPVYASLAQEFAVCDRWFASVPSSTQPNRLYVHSGTSHGAVANDPSLLVPGLPQRTIFDDIYDSGLSFSVYYQNTPTVLFYRSLRQVKYTPYIKPYDLWFKQDAAAGRLPNYVVIEQRYFDVAGAPANDDHPSHDVSEGQKLVKEVYEALRASPQWGEMLFLVTYDEHGGFFDHVPTPVNGVPSPDRIVSRPPFNFTFERLGVRVPAFIISPWIEKGTVIHSPNGPTPTSQFEHSSVPATVRKLFNLPSKPLTAREAWAGTFDGLFYQRSTPRTDCPEELPSPPWSLRHSEPDGKRVTSEFQQELVQLSAGLMRSSENALRKIAAEVGTVEKANKFVEDAIARFLKAGKAALEEGLEGNTVVHI